MPLQPLLRPDVRVLLTGATGFVGAEVARRLVLRGAAVTALARAPASRTRLEGLPVAFATGDVTDRASLQAPFAAADCVFHVAGLVSYRTRSRAEQERVNVEGTRNVMAAALAAGVKRVVHTSSVVAVGAARAPVLQDETAEWDCADLRSPYFDTKRAAEDEVRRAVERGLDAVIVNPAAVMGPGDSRGNLVALARRIVAGKKPWMPPGGVNLVALGDVAEGHLLAMDRGRTGERYLLTAENVTWTEAARRVARALGVAARAAPIPRPAYRALIAAAAIVDRFVDASPPLCPGALWPMGRFSWWSAAKAERELGFRPGPVEPALDAAVRAMRESGLLAAPSGAIVGEREDPRR